MKGSRPERMAATMKVELCELIASSLKDPRVTKAGLLTVTEVRLTPDLGTARVYVSLVGGAPGTDEVALAALGRSAGFLRGELARRLDLRRAPTIHFVQDKTGEEAARIAALLHEAPREPDEPDER